MNTLGELRTTVLSWVNREDQSSIDIFPTILRLAESDIYRDLRTRENEFTASYDNTATAAEVAQLPQNFREMKQILWRGQPLVEISYQRLSQRLYDGSDNEAWFFAINERQISFSQALGDPAGWGDDTLEYTYYGSESLDSLPTWQTPTNPVTDPVTPATVTPLTQPDTNTTRVLQVHPKVYLYACVAHMNGWLQKEDEASLYEQKVAVAIAEINAADASGSLTGSTVAVTSVYNDGSYR